MNNLSFKYRFIFTFVLVEIFFILLIVGINFFAINNTSKELVNKEITTTKHLLNSLVKLPLSVFDLATLDDISNQSLVGSVNSILIFDGNNNLLSKNYNIKTEYKKIQLTNTNETLNIKEDNNQYLIHRTDIKEEEVLLGYVILVFDTNEINNYINKNKSNTLLIIFLEILISTFIAYILGKSLTEKLTKLTLIAEKIGDGEKVEIHREKTKNEISKLNNSIAKMYHDINLRNEKLKEAKIVFDNIKEAIIILDQNKNILSANDSFFNLTSYKIEEIKESNFFKKMEINIDDIALFKDNNYKEEIIIKIKNDKYITALLNISILKELDGTIKNYIIFIVDITKEKKREELLQIQSKMATMGEMIGNIAHQWRQPLSAISSAASSVDLQSELDILTKEELHQTLNIIIKSTKYLSETIEDFRNFFKSDKEIKEFDLDELISSLDKILLSSLKHNDIDFSLIKSKNHIHIFGYKNELMQALLNIINNAKDALILNKISNKEIIVNIKDEENDLIIEISDNAGGIPDNILPKIFEPYFTTKHQSQGTGIGLYMTHTIITQHFKGEIKASNYNNGTLFEIKIPKNIYNS